MTKTAKSAKGANWLEIGNDTKAQDSQHEDRQFYNLAAFALSSSIFNTSSLKKPKTANSRGYLSTKTAKAAKVRVRRGHASGSSRRHQREPEERVQNLGKGPRQHRRGLC